MIILNQWGHEEGLDRNTVAQYLTNAKIYHLEVLSLEIPPSPAWGIKGQHHPWISRTLKSIPRTSRRERMEITIDWIHDAFRHKVWDTPEFVAIALMYGWMLRVSEVTATDSGHGVKWSMVTFFHLSESGALTPMPMTDLRSTPCGYVQLQLESRKYQSDEVRRMPGRMNTAHFVDPSQGLSIWSGLCVATILQAWAIANAIDVMTPHDRNARFVLTRPGTIDNVVTYLDIVNALHKQARRRPDVPGWIATHNLRASSITRMANSSVGQCPETMLLATGHKNLTSMEPYVKPGQAMAEQLSSVLQNKSFRH